MEQLDTANSSWKSGLVPANDGLNVDNQVSQIDSTKEFLTEVRDLKAIALLRLQLLSRLRPSHSIERNENLAQAQRLQQRTRNSTTLSVGGNWGQRGVDGMEREKMLSKLCWMQWLPSLSIIIQSTIHTKHHTSQSPQHKLHKSERKTWGRCTDWITIFWLYPSNQFVP